MAIPIIKNYLQNVNSSLLDDINNLDTEQLARNLRIADGPTEFYFLMIVRRISFPIVR